jgi:hypothetical protein
MSIETKTVYILGAGCSAGQQPAGAGFPLACEFVSALDKFGQERLLGNGCQELKALVVDTVKLLRQEKVQTLDALVARLGAEARDTSNRLTNQERRQRDVQVLNSKIATAALFLDLETKAKEAGLPRYDNFLSELFGNSVNWAEASRKAHCNVLTFNYDRLFEMAFLSRFRSDAGQYPLYGKSILNSGLDFEQGTSIDFDASRFLFLKLHGSAGIRARNENSRNCPDPCIYPCYDGLPGGDGKPINDERFFAHRHNPDPYERDPEPLIVFPHEKPFVAQGRQTHLPFGKYIQSVWREAHRLVAEATTIRAIGYGFAPMDRDDVLGLLRSARNCNSLVVQNRPGVAEEICQRLKLTWLVPEGLNLNVEPFSQPF